MGAPWPAPRRFEIDELLVRPGTYLNPQTEVLIVVDDSAEIDQATLEGGARRRGRWVLVSDEAPIDEAARDELLERFQATYHEGGPERGARRRTTEDDSDEDDAGAGRGSREDAELDELRALGEGEGQREDGVDREQLDALEPRRLALVRDVVGDQHGEEDRRRARSR